MVEDLEILIVDSLLLTIELPQMIVVVVAVVDVVVVVCVFVCLPVWCVFVSMWLLFRMFCC